MPDWNPAEIIGIKPHNLALNLYKILITDDIWSKSRSELGYKNIENTPLMYDFLGTPYIDLRADLNSFIPKNIDEKDSEKLVNFYLNKYKKNPEFFFDKIESELVISSFDFAIDDKIKKIGNILNKNSKIKLKNEIKNLTLGIIKNIRSDIEKYQKLKIHLNSLNNKKLYSFNKIQELIKIGKSYGTLPFANLARSGFVAVALINSMLNKKIINTEIKEKFLQSIPSITKEMNNELIKLSRKEFLKKYGHLRPNTYDIMSDNYKTGYKKYFDFKNLRPIIIKNYKFDKKIITSISKYLKKHQFPIKVKELLSFIKLSIEHRERAKLEFSKIIDLIFYEIDKISKRFNIKKEDKKFIDIFDIIKLYSEFKNDNIKKFIQKKIKKNKHDYEFNNSIELPNNILNGSDVFFYEEKINSPTFITTSVVTDRIIFLNDKNLNKNLNNKIICIKNADPGFDFIFTKKIKGLITVYGGPNSHMSIRCAELNIPAAIGIGPQIYETIRTSKKITLDTSQKKITQI
jgi:phosphohistidine swiveling domain-containing protein